MTTETIKIQDGDTVVELTGEAKEAFLTERKANEDAKALRETEYEAKKQLRIDAITKLGEASGLTEDEINAIIGAQ
jgi:ubiquitin